MTANALDLNTAVFWWTVSQILTEFIYLTSVHIFKNRYVSLSVSFFLSAIYWSSKNNTPGTWFFPVLANAS